MHCHCGTNNRAPRWTFTDPCKPEVRPGAASPAWLAAPAMNARDTTKVYIWRLDSGCGPTLYRKCHSHNTPGKRHNNTWVEPLADVMYDFMIIVKIIMFMMAVFSNKIVCLLLWKKSTKLLHFKTYKMNNMDHTNTAAIKTFISDPL